MNDLIINLPPNWSWIKLGAVTKVLVNIRIIINSELRNMKKSKTKLFKR